MAIPMLDLKAHYEPIQAELEAAVLSVMRSGSYILGPNVSRLEQEVASLCKVKYGIGVASGTDALVLSLMALEIGPGDEVITTPYSFFATASCIHRVGAKPVFVDIKPDTYNLDDAKVAQAITQKTKAILPVHLFGQPANMNGLTALASSHGLHLIEDAAQAIGARYHGQPVGSFGDLGCFSFYPSKNLGAIGDAGLIVTDHEDLAKRLRSLRVHGAAQTYFHDTVGLNSRLHEVQAAILITKLPYLTRWTEQRQRNAALYTRLLADLPVVTPYVEPACDVIYNQYVVQIGPKRDYVCQTLQSLGIGHSIYYPLPLHLQPCFAYLGYRQGAFPVAEQMARETIALPIYPELTPEQIQLVCEGVTRGLGV